MNPMHSLRLAVLFSAAAIAAHAGDGVTEINHARALAGGITPGDTQGYPITLSRSGSYRLTGNLTLPNANTNGIEIGADEITIDLNGFEIIGAARCTLEAVHTVACTGTGSGHGIVGSGPTVFAPESILIRNGTIRGAGANGINYLFGRVERVRLVSNGGLGVQLPTGEAVDGPSGGNAVVGTTAIRNGLGGIIVGSSAVLEGNTVSFNGGPGIDCGGDCVMTGNVASENAGNGLSCSTGVVRGNTSNSNGIWGLNGGSCGYAENFFGSNLSGSVTGGTEMGVNVCGADTTCP